MKKYILPLLLLLLVLPAAAVEKADTASLTGKYLLLNLPGAEMSLVPRDLRERMIDYYEYHTPYSPQNALGGSCSLDSLSRDYARLSLTAISSLQMCVLPMGKKQVAAVVYTIDGGGSPDSQLTIYDASLKPLKLNKFFKEPQLKMFLSPEGAELQSLVPFLLVTYELLPDPSGATLTATLNIRGSMTEEDYARIEPYIARKSISYRWDGHRFKLLN